MSPRSYSRSRYSRAVRRLFRRHRPAPHRFLGLARRVFEVAALEGDVQQVRVHRIGRAAFLVLHVDRDAGASRVLRAAFRATAGPIRATARSRGCPARARNSRARSAPGRCLCRSRHAHTASARVFVRDLDLALGDQRPRDRRAEQVFAFIDGVRAEHREHEVAHELLAQVVDEEFRLDAELLRFGARRLEFFALADVGGEGDDFAAGRCPAAISG